MCHPIDIHQKIPAYCNLASDHLHHRYRSWEHCYGYFRSRPREAHLAEPNLAALHLGFYLASWGMYRGSSFLLQCSYTVHKGVVEQLASNWFSDLWEAEIGSERSHEYLIPLMLAAICAVRKAYKPFGHATDTLVSKVLLGTLGCLPACDRFFVSGLRKSGHQYSYINRKFVTRMLDFCVEHKKALRHEQTSIRDSVEVCYPFMKLVDMYFWQLGYESAS